MGRSDSGFGNRLAGWVRRGGLLVGALIAVASQSCGGEPPGRDNDVGRTTRPAPDRSAQIRESTGRLRKLIVDRLAAVAPQAITTGARAERPSVYLDVRGRPTRVRVLGADAETVTVSAEGMEVRLTWERIPPPRFASMAAKFAMTASEHLLVARYFALHGLREGAEECCRKARKVGTAGRSDDAARALEDGLEDEIRSALALLPTEPERPKASKPPDVAGERRGPDQARHRGEARETSVDYHKALDRLAGAHPKVLVRGLAEFRQRFPRGFGDIVRSYKRLDGELGKPLMPEPPATKTKTQFLETMDRIRRFCGRMDRFGQSYLVTGNEAHGKEAARCLLHIASWDLEAGGGFRACDEVPMSIMQLGPRVYDWVYPLLSEEDRALVRGVFRARGVAMFKRVGEGKRVPRDSHGGRMLGFVGVAGIAFYGEFPEASLWLDAMVELIRAKYPEWGGDDGGWAEGPQYWSWYMGYMIPFLASFEIATGSDVLCGKPFFRNTIYFGLYCSPLDLPVAPFGDGAERNAASAKAADARFFGTVYGDGYFLWYASQTRSRPGFHDACVACSVDRARAQPKPPEDIEQSRYFRDIGWVAMHSALARPEEDVFLLWKCSPYGGRSHSHADQNAFVLSAFGKPLAIATGYYYSYGSPHHYGWTRQTKANNCILVATDGDWLGQAARQGAGVPECYLSDSAAGWGGGFTYARGDAAGVYEGRLTKALRHVVKLDERTFVIADDLEAPRPAKFSWLLHALEKMTLDEERAEIVSTNGEAKLFATVLAPRGVELAQSSRFDPPPVQTAIATRGKPNRPDQYHASASTREKSKWGAFIVRLLVQKGSLPSSSATTGGERVEESPHAVSAAWEDKDGRWVIIMRRRGAPPAHIRFEEARLAGEFAALRIERGKVMRFLVAEATGLRWGKDALFTSAAPASVSLARDSAGRWRVGLASTSRRMQLRFLAPSGMTARARFFPERLGEPRKAEAKLSGGKLVIAHPGEGGTIVLRRR